MPVQTGDLVISSPGESHDFGPVDGGRIATGLVENGVTRLAIGRKIGASFGLVAFADAEASVLPGFARPHAFVF